MIEKWVNFKRDYLEISFLRENCGYDGSDDRRRCACSWHNLGVHYKRDMDFHHIDIHACDTNSIISLWKVFFMKNT